MNRHPNHWLALDIYSERKADMKAVLEARLLSGENNETIAARTGLSIEVVECYALSYYDVQDRLGFSDFIHSQVLGCDARGTGEVEREYLLKRIAYSAGPEALDLVLKAGPSTSQRGENDPVQELYRCIEGLLLEKTFASADRVDLSSEQSVRTMLLGFARQQAARAKGGNLSPGQESYLKNVEAFLKAIPFGLASRDMPEELKPWADTPAELRADEMLLVSAGVKLENEEELRNMKSREPRLARD